MSANELKPCKCGRLPEENKAHFKGISNVSWFTCSCGAFTPLMYFERKDAIVAWNKMKVEKYGA